MNKAETFRRDLIRSGLCCRLFGRSGGGRRRQERCHRSGFTLHELIVTIMMVAIMSLGMSGFLVHVFSLQRAQWRQAVARDVISEALHRLDHTLRYAEQVDFDGTSLSVLFPQTGVADAGRLQSESRLRTCELVVDGRQLMEKMCFATPEGDEHRVQALIDPMLDPGLWTDSIRLHVETSRYARIRVDIEVTAAFRESGEQQTIEAGGSKWIPILNAR